MQESYKQTSPMHGPRPTFNPGIAGYPAQQDVSPITKSEPEIFLAVNYLSKLQDDLADAIEKLTVKLGPVMRSPYPQENMKDTSSGEPQTALGRNLQDNINRMNLHITIIKELNDRTCL